MAAWRAAERASGRCERRSLITSREAPTMARWDLTARRRRVLAASCGSCEYLVSVEVPGGSGCGGCVPQRYPFSSGDGRERSTRSCGGSCAGGRETRTCRTGSGRSCCPNGRRACPVEHVSAQVLSRYCDQYPITKSRSVRLDMDPCRGHILRLSSRSSMCPPQ